MITLHHLRIGRSLFTVWLLEELGVDYKLEVYHRDEAGRAPPELKNIHPLGKSPVIDDGGFVLTETGAITSYILQKYDDNNVFAPRPSELQDWARYTQWLSYPEASVFAPLLLKMLIARSGVDHPVITPFSKAEINLHLTHITKQLADNEYILGKFSGADFGISYVVSVADRLGQLTDYPALSKYLKRVTERPAFQRAVKNAVE